MIHSIEDLKILLKSSAFLFEYKKKDGTLREAFGTLNAELIPEEFLPKDSSTFKAKNLRYFDLEKKEWRSISGDIIEVEVIF